MRITGGLNKGWRLPSGFAAHVRPTTDMVRESLFNMLSHRHEIEGARVLDLFSGSGIMALEFISRGALEVHSVDRDMTNIRFQHQVRSRLGFDHWHIHKSDVFRFLDNNSETWDFVYADPPYDLPGITNLPDMALPLLKPDGWFLLEHRPGVAFMPAPAEVRHYGSTACSIFVK